MCEMAEERQVLAMACMWPLTLLAEDSPSPICCEAEGQNELVQEISREGPVTKLDRSQNPFF